MGLLVSHAPSRPLLARGEGLSLRALFEAQAGFVLRLLRRMGVAEADLDDALQEVFVVVHRRLEQYDGTCKVETWMFGITRRVASEFRRRPHVRREATMSEPPETVAEAAGPQEQAEQAELRRLLAAALDRLDDDKRSVFVLYELEGMTMNDVAQAVECPLQTAYSRLHAARDIVRRALERAFGDRP